MDVELAVAVLGHEPARRLPTRRPQLGVIGLPQGNHLAPIAGPTEDVPRRQVDAGERVDEVLAAGPELDVVRAVTGGELHEASAVEIHSVDLTIIRVRGGLPAEADEGDLLGGFVDVEDGLHHPATAREGL